MKKLFTYLSVAMLAVAAVSCQKEMVVEEGNGNVTFTIQTPEVATKAIADGTNVNIVRYEVYKAGSGHDNSIIGGKPLIDSKIEDFNGRATLKLNLLQNQDYVVLFWAEVAGTSYYDTRDLRKVVVDYNRLDANDEARAAFCQKLEFNSSKTYSANVTLVRPFAQINLGTTADSINPEVNGYNLDIKSSYMKVVGAATTFSVTSMTTGSETTTVEFAASTVPHDFTPDSEVLTVNDVNYVYLGMNYILAAADAATVDVTYEVNTNVGSISRQIPAVPVQKNHRTNLLGNLLTQETAIEIVVDERFAEPDLEPEAIYMLAANGGELTLTEDLTLEEHVYVQSNFNLNLNGKTIKYTGDDVLFRVKNGATMTIDGTVEGSAIVTNPTTVGTGGNGYVALISEGATLNINGGDYDAQASCTVAQVSKGTLNVYGGSFKVNLDEYTDANGEARYLLNCSDTPYKNGEAVINVYGGTFYKFNPENNAAEGAGTNFVNENCSVIVEGDYYNVVLTTVSTAEELMNAFAVAPEIKLANDIDLTNVKWTPVGTAEKPFSGTFDGQGYTISGLKVAETEYAAFIAYAGENTTIKNVTLKDVDINSTKHAAGVVCITGEGLLIDNVTVSGNIVAASYAGGLVHNGENVTVKNSVNNANVSANRAGGIGSWLTVGASLENVANNGTINGAVGASGIVHGFAGTIKNAVNNGAVTSNGVEAAAGIAGVQKAASTYEYCYNYGAITSTYDDANSSAAGILGQSPGSASTLKYCANYGAVTAEQSYAAGIAYSLYGTINASYCYNKGAITGADGAGAIAPKAQYGTADKALCCLNAGVVSSANGTVYQASNKNESCYYYNGDDLLNVANDTLVEASDALEVLNGGSDKNFFTTEGGKIVVK